MKNKLLLGLALPLTLLLAACGGQADEKEKQEEATPACFYSYNSGSTVLEWSAYKFTEKKAVKGTFTDVQVSGGQESDDAKELLKGMTFTISTKSVESQDPDRNKKIVEHFFGTIGADQIVGNLVSLSDDGKAVLKIKLGKAEGELKGTYSLENNQFIFDAAMDVVNWNAGSGIEALNKICKDLHTGPDGVSKLWSEVGIHFETTLQSDCQ